MKRRSFIKKCLILAGTPSFILMGIQECRKSNHKLATSDPLLTRRPCPEGYEEKLELISVDPTDGTCRYRLTRRNASPVARDCIDAHRVEYFDRKIRIELGTWSHT